MAKEDKKGAEIAPLFPLVEGKVNIESVESVEEVTEEVTDKTEPPEQDTNKHQWKVLTPFYDVIQKRVVQVGEIVEHNQKRVDYNLIEKA